jgi:molybdenum cofactor synthesis domain-containing protein
MEYNLLEKTELWVTGIRLRKANLTALAAAAAEVLGLEPPEVQVVDVQEDRVTLDILRRTVRGEDVAGKQAALLQRLSALPGVELAPGAAVHSDGVLGIIALDPAEVPDVLTRTREMTESILSAVARRAIVYSTGFELRRGLIEDTNGPFIRSTLEARGLKVTIGSVLEDDEHAVALAFNAAVNQGYGLALTTGGVGAESKDRSVEGLLHVDPAAATAWLVKYEKGQGRHEKEGVRIAVGQLGPTLMIALPGPHDEVRTAMQVLCRHLDRGTVDKYALAEEIASAIRTVLATRMQHWGHSGSHSHN